MSTATTAVPSSAAPLEKLTVASSITPSNAAGNLTIEGISPTLVSLAWSASTDGSLFFSSYQVNVSFNGSGGPYIQLANITDVNETEIGFYGAEPGFTYWWEVTTWDCFIVCYTTGTTGPVAGTQPTNATAYGFWINDTAMNLSWTNPSFYGGNVSFGWYYIYESVNGSGYFLAGFQLDPFVTWFWTNFSYDTSYSFYVETFDTLWNGINFTSYGSNSSYVNFTTPSSPLTAVATVSSATADVGQTLTFNCTASGGFSPLYYTWAFGDGGLGYSANMTYAYATTGTFSGGCDVTDFIGVLMSSNLVSVSVSPDPTAATPTASVVSADVGQSVTFTSVTTPGSGSLVNAWSGLPSGCSGTANPLTCTVTTAGSYTVSLTVTDSNGFDVSSGALTFVVYPQPTAQAPTASASSVLQGSSITLNVSTTAGSGGLAYVWTGLPAGCSSSSSATITCSPSATGTFTVTVTVTDSNGGTATSAPLSFKVDPSFLGLPATTGYAVLGGGIAVIVVALAAAMLLMRRRRKNAASKGGPSGPESSPPANPPQSPPQTPPGAPPS